MTTTPPSGPTQTIADLLAASGTGFDANGRDYDMLNAALSTAGLTGVVADAAADLTLLAPTDAAFVSLARSLGYQANGEQGAFEAIVAALTTLGGGDPIPLLTDILRSHLLPGGLGRGEILSATSLETLQPGFSLAPFGTTLGDGDPDAADAGLVGPTRAATNGTLQAINEVILPIDVPGNSDDLPAPPSVAGIVAASGDAFDTNGADFDILLKAVQTAGLTEALADPAAALTVFAPTDAAFIKLARDLGFTGTDEAGAFDAIAAALASLSPSGDAVPLLSDILLYHVAGERLSKAQADAAGPITMLSGGTIEVAGNRILDADPDQPDARFVPGATDILAANGAVQVIDSVLLPADLDLEGGLGMTIADRLAISGTGFDTNRQDFDILNAALDAAGLTATFDGATLDATLFAPTDAAFINLARSLGYRGNAEQGAFDAIVATLTTLGEGDPIPLLTEILTYHVGTESLTFAEIRATPSITTLAGETINPFGRSLGDLDPTLADAGIIVARADLEASNGIVQAIDRVLLPLDVAEVRGSAAPRGTLADLVAASGDGPDDNAHDYDILQAALAATGLDAALDDAGASLTLLAPTDAAFLRLAQELGVAATTEQAALDGILETLGTLGGTGDPVPLLTDILSYHVLDGRFSREQLREAGEAETLLAEAEALGFRGRRIDDVETGYVARFEGRGDVLADNGALHAIDGVLLPLNLDLI